MGHTLVLNSDYTPLSIIPISTLSWKDSIKMSWMGNVNPIEFYGNWEVHSPSITLLVPSVVVSQKFNKKKISVRFSRASLLLRDNHVCQYCFDELTLNHMTIDHVIPRTRGGTTRWDNVVASCHACNSRKGSRIHIKPHVAPVKPTQYELAANARKRPIVVPHESWIPYIGWPESLITVCPPKKDIE